MVFKKGCVPWNIGKTGIYSEKTRESMGHANKGIRRSPATEFKKGHVPYTKGRPRSEQTKQKIREKLHGRIITPENLFVKGHSPVMKGKENPKLQWDKHPNFRHGERYSHIYFRRQGGELICSECRVKGFFGMGGIIVHHIDGNRKNNDLSNLMSLCMKCHNRLHRGGDKY